MIEATQPEARPMESTIEVDCIICGFAEGISMLAHTEQIAYFGEHTQITLTCPGCGWRQTDFIPAESREGSCQCFLISKTEDLKIRVIRGSACTVRLLELDLEVRPGSHSTGYVSNIEGVLNRFQEVIDMVGRQAAVEENWAAITELTKLTETMMEIRDGKSSVTLEMLDPCGHSMILTDNVEERPLTDAEVDDLPVGPAAGLMEAGAAQSRAGPVTDE
jgi:zinc finger protein